MERNPLKLAPEGCDARHRTRSLGRAQTVQQPQRTVDAIHWRRLEPLEGVWVGAPREQIEQRTGDVDSRNLRLAVRPQPIAASHNRRTTD